MSDGSTIVRDRELRDDPPVEPRGKPLWREALEIALAAAILFVFSRAFVFEQSRIPSGSMEQTLQVGDYVLVNRSIFAPATGFERHLRPAAEPQRGEVIVFRHPERPEVKYIKRLIAVEGDWVEIRRGVVYVNGRALDEPYVAEEYVDPRQFVAPQRVLPGHLFVLGDHRSDSADSEEWGQVRRELVLGRGVLIWWSFRPPGFGRGLPTRVGDRLSFGLARTRWGRCFKLIR